MEKRSRGNNFVWRKLLFFTLFLFSFIFLKSFSVYASNFFHGLDLVHQIYQRSYNFKDLSLIGQKLNADYQMSLRGSFSTHRWGGGGSFVFIPDGSRLREDSINLIRKVHRRDFLLHFFYDGTASFSSEIPVEILFGLHLDVWKWSFAKPNYHNVLLFEVHNLSPEGKSGPHISPYLGVSVKKGLGQLKFKLALNFYFFPHKKALEGEEAVHNNRVWESFSFVPSIKGGHCVSGFLAYALSHNQVDFQPWFKFYAAMKRQLSITELKLRPGDPDIGSVGFQSYFESKKGQVLESVSGFGGTAGVDIHLIVNQNFNVGFYVGYNFLGSRRLQKIAGNDPKKSEQKKADRSWFVGMGGKIFFP